MLLDCQERRNPRHLFVRSKTYLYYSTLAPLLSSNNKGTPLSKVYVTAGTSALTSPSKHSAGHNDVFRNTGTDLRHTNASTMWALDTADKETLEGGVTAGVWLFSSRIMARTRGGELCRFRKRLKRV